MKRINEGLNMKWTHGLLASLIWLCGIGVSLAAAEEDSHAGHDHAVHAHEMNTGVHEKEEPHGAHAAEAEHEDHPEEAHAHDHEEKAHASESGADLHDHGEEGDAEEGLRLTPEQIHTFGIVVSPAASGQLQNEVRLPGEIVFNEDQVVHMVPRVSGVVQEVRFSVGDRVKAGDVMAVIESRELADAKSDFLMSRARAALAETTFSREQALREKQVTSESDYLAAEQALSEARIALRSMEQKLQVLGLSATSIQAVETESGNRLARYELRSPIDGVVTEKHMALGESLEADADIFTVADMSSVWVNLTVYIKNLGVVQAGQEVTLQVDHSGAQAQGRIHSVTPFVEESTRSAMARVVLDNSDARWMPGTFVTGFSRISEENIPVVVPRDAVQNIEGTDHVFIEHDGAYEAVPVTLGRMDRTHVEILDGLVPGMPYVSSGAFQLKATVITSNLDSHAGHGH